MELNYTHWEDYYRETFLPTYNEFVKKDIENIDSYEFIKLYINLFEVSTSLMKYYLANYGRFTFDSIASIKEFYRHDLLEDAQEWIDLAFYIKKKFKNLPKDYYDNILRFYKQNGLDMFENLVTVFEGFLNENE